MSAPFGIVGLVGAVLFRQIDRNQGTNRPGVEQQISIESVRRRLDQRVGTLMKRTVEVIEDGEDIAVGVEGDFEEKKLLP